MKFFTSVRLKRILRTAEAVLRDQWCSVCRARPARFTQLSSHYTTKLLEHESDLRLSQFETISTNNYSCEACHASDRDRLYAFYIAKRLAKDPGPAFCILDIAPANSLSRYIRGNYSINYRTADLFMPDVDDHADITNMACYTDGLFDAFICSHVLEHVHDDRKAMSELYRILKPGGWGIVMAPINLKLASVREGLPSITESDRWRNYGQDDHIRVYNKAGFIQRLADTGFKVIQNDVSFFGKKVLRQLGLSASSCLYVVEKTTS